MRKNIIEKFLFFCILLFLILLIFFLNVKNISADLQSANIYTEKNNIVPPIYVKDIPEPPIPVQNLDDVFYRAVGDATYLYDNQVLKLTNGVSEHSAIWGKNKVNLKKDFQLESWIYLEGKSPADGMTFTLQNYGNNWIGDLGGNLGAYNKMHYNRVSVEIDFYNNGDRTDRNNPDTYNHMAITSGKKWDDALFKTPTHMAYGSFPQGIVDSTWKKIIINYKNISYNEEDQTGIGKLSWQLIDINGNKLGANEGPEFEYTNTQKNSLFTPDWLSSNEQFWGFTASTGASASKQAMVFERLPQLQNIEAKNSTLIAGESWNPEDNFVKAEDAEGNSIPWGDNRVSYKGTVDTSQEGDNEIIYQVDCPTGIMKTTVIVTVKADKSSINTIDSELYVDETWDKNSNFVNATDEEGKVVPWNDLRISSKNANVDTSKPGTYNLKYTFNGKFKNTDSKFTVIVKEDKSSIQTKNTTLQVGQIWHKESNFVDATDEDGTPVPWSDSRISSNGASVDTSKSGVTKLRYTYKGKVKNTESEFTVTVEDPLKLIVPSSSDFGTYKLGSSNIVLPWNKASKVKIEGATNSQWDLSVALNSKSSLKDYIKIGEMPITETSQKVLSGRGPMSVTDELSPDKFIKVDYTGVKQLRKDIGALQWTLTPSTKGISE